MTTIRLAPAGKIPLDFILWSRDISTREFARQIGEHETSVGRWRKGLLPTEKQRRKIARKLKLSEAELGWGEKEPAGV